MVHVPGPQQSAREPSDLPGRRIVHVFKVIAGGTTAGGFDLQVLTEETNE